MRLNPILMQLEKKFAVNFFLITLVIT